tara:strand:+ start:328 stop:606 length:279 start_codon:yes stop_codon:yes gene_type:complete
MAIFSGEVTIKVKFKDIQVAVGYGMTSAIIKHRCVQQAYARSPWSEIKNQKDDRFVVVVEKGNIGYKFYKKCPQCEDGIIGESDWGAHIMAD